MFPHHDLSYFCARNYSSRAQLYYSSIAYYRYPRFYDSSIISLRSSHANSFLFARIGIMDYNRTCICNIRLAQPTHTWRSLALIGVWWFILAIVLIMLHPTRHGATSLSILIPFSFPIGAYFNLLSLPRKLNLRDRRIFRLLLIASALLFVCTTIYYSIFYPSATPLLTVFLFLAFLFLIQIVFIVQHNYKGRKLPVHLTEISFIVFAILFAIGNIQFVFP